MFSETTTGSSLWTAQVRYIFFPLQTVANVTICVRDCWVELRCDGKLFSFSPLILRMGVAERLLLFLKRLLDFKIFVLYLFVSSSETAQ